MIDSRAVLIVEDDKGCVDLIDEVVKDLGCRTEVCGRVADAISIIAERAPRLVILDVILPDGEGFQVLEAIRADPRTASLPVILCTAALLEVTTYYHPAQDERTELVVKPFHILSFVETITRMLALA